MDSSTLLELVKNGDGITDAAKHLNITRPTFYKYVRQFSEGNKEGVPEDIRRYLENIVKENIIDEQNQKDANSLISDIDSLESEIKLMENMIDDIIKETNEDSISAYANDQKIAELKQSIDEHSLNINMKREKLTQLRSKMKISSTDISKNLNELHATCFFDGSKYMIVHDGIIDDISYYMLCLNVKINGEFKWIGTYRPEKDRGFFIIDDVVFTAPLYFQIFKMDENAEEWQPEICSTGMCELKDSRSNDLTKDNKNL